MHAMLKDELDLDGKPNLNLARYISLVLYPRRFWVLIDDK